MFLYNDDGEYEEHIRYIEKRMEDQRAKVLASLSQVIHPKYLESFAKILAFSCLAEEQDALTLAESFNLNQKDFLAIIWDFDKYEEELVKERYDWV
jgi:hypothetical protein